MKRINYKLLYIFPLWFLIHVVLITVDGLSDEGIFADAALIYGNKVEETGKMSPRLKARVDKGLELYKQRIVRKLVVSGGLGKEGFYEAQVMKKYLVAQGVPGTDVLVDDEGVDTRATTLNYLKIAEAHKLSSVVVVSQFCHITRAKQDLRKHGVSHVSGAHAEYFEIRDVYSLVREFGGYYKYLIL